MEDFSKWKLNLRGMEAIVTKKIVGMVIFKFRIY